MSASYRYQAKATRPAPTQLPAKIFITLFYARSAAVSVLYQVRRVLCFLGGVFGLVFWGRVNVGIRKPGNETLMRVKLIQMRFLSGTTHHHPLLARPNCLYFATSDGLCGNIHK